MRRVLCINPTSRDHRELQYLHDATPLSCTFHGIADYTVSFDIENSYIPLTQEIDRILDNISDLHFDGVFATNDYPGQIVSSIIAHEMGLLGPTPQTILPLQDKYYARHLHQDIAPEATPAFEAVSPHDPYLHTVTFPCIVKPIKGAGSLGTFYVENNQQLMNLVQYCNTYVKPFYELLTAYTYHRPHDATIIAEAYMP